MNNDETETKLTDEQSNHLWFVVITFLVGLGLVAWFDWRLAMGCLFLKIAKSGKDGYEKKYFDQ